MATSNLIKTVFEIYLLKAMLNLLRRDTKPRKTWMKLDMLAAQLYRDGDMRYPIGEEEHREMLDAIKVLTEKNILETKVSFEHLDIHEHSAGRLYRQFTFVRFKVIKGSSVRTPVDAGAD